MRNLYNASHTSWPCPSLYLDVEDLIAQLGGIVDMAVRRIDPDGDISIVDPEGDVMLLVMRDNDDEHENEKGIFLLSAMFQLS